MHNGLSFYQTTFPALPPLSNIIFNRAVLDKKTLLRPESQEIHYYYTIATKLAKAYHCLLL